MSTLGNIVSALLALIKPDMTPAEVNAALQARAAGKNLNWQSSIVDLLKLLGQPSSFADRKALAAELGVTNYTGTAEQNQRLHALVIERVASRGIRLS